MNLHRQVIRGIAATIIGLALVGIPIFEDLIRGIGLTP